MPKPIDINAYIAEHPGVLTVRDWRGTHPVVRYDYAETKAYVIDDGEHWYSIQANDILHAHGLSAEPPRYAMGETV